ALFGIIVTLLLFVIVVLHELGHSVAAQNYGVPVKQIVLLPIGGVAQLGRFPEEPIQEFVIAIAGPLVNFGLALVFLLVASLFQFGGVWENPFTMLERLESLSPMSIFNYVFVSNLFLGIFNLIPAFPMDGGRVLRALLASRMNYARATSIAVAVGQTMAWLLGLWGFLGGGFFLILIAIFVYMGAGQEGRLVQIRNVLGGLKVEQAYSRQAQSISPQSTLKNAVEMTLSTFQADFPVCDGQNLVGLLTHSRLVESLNQYGPDVFVDQVMLKDIEPVSPGEGLFEVQQRLVKQNLDALPVVERGNFLGLITNRDINELYRLVSNQPGLLPAVN
ncbi:MAG: site-2 protease family protein, partial [Anaerolineales bacterium]